MVLASQRTKIVNTRTSNYNVHQANTLPRRQSQEINSRNINGSQSSTADVNTESSSGRVVSSDPDTLSLSTPAQVERMSFAAGPPRPYLCKSSDTSPDKRKFNGSDFVSFERYITMIAAGAGVSDVLNGTQQAPTVPRSLDIMQLVGMELVGYAQWNWYRQAVTQLNMLIENSCAPLVARQITQLMNPSERMEHLKLYYFGNSVARKNLLADKYDQWNWCVEHSIASNLSNLEKLVADLQAVGIPRDEVEVVSNLFRSVKAADMTLYEEISFKKHDEVSITMMKQLLLNAEQTVALEERNSSVRVANTASAGPRRECYKC
ncbi:hypothetical protein MP228_012404 [Amoeboaphelidium protococcarum]|nr:hypothetical protein MP228_012404 [Amoeboaphelidium protococcarum]